MFVVRPPLHFKFDLWRGLLSCSVPVFDGSEDECLEVLGVDVCWWAFGSLVPAKWKGIMNVRVWNLLVHVLRVEVHLSRECIGRPHDKRGNLAGAQ